MAVGAEPEGEGGGAGGGTQQRGWGRGSAWDAGEAGSGRVWREVWEEGPGALGAGLEA